MIKLDADQVELILRVETAVRERAAAGGKAGARPVRRQPLLGRLGKAVSSLTDYLLLLIRHIPQKGRPEVFFTAPGLTKYEEFIGGRIGSNALLVNYHTTKRMKRLAGLKVYNVGIVVGILKRLFNRRNDMLRTIRLCDLVYAPLYPKLKGASVFIPCYHDHSAYALLFNRRRNTYEITEVQHGSICNYFPYTDPASFRLVDRFVVWNERTATFLKEHLYRDVDVDIEISGQARARRLPSEDGRWTILYCSSIETNGVHPAFASFLQAQEDKRRYNLVVRLHPREKERQPMFEEQLKALGWTTTFDDSPDWLEGNPYEKTVVVSPWSSTIEEAYDNDIPSVVLDDFGIERFRNIIDESLCFTSIERCFEAMDGADGASSG